MTIIVVLDSFHACERIIKQTRERRDGTLAFIIYTLEACKYIAIQNYTGSFKLLQIYKIYINLFFY